MRTVAEELNLVICETLPLLRAVPERRASRATPSSWSPKQIVGHLIDSAANNHQRFVRAQLGPDLVFPGYEQERWVELQGYQSAAWSDLVDLWAAYNRHLARVIARVPVAERRRPRARHNLHELAWRPVPADSPATLEDFMADYVGHLKHHLRQIFTRLARPGPASVDDAAPPSRELSPSRGAS